MTNKLTDMIKAHSIESLRYKGSQLSCRCFLWLNSLHQKSYLPEHYHLMGAVKNVMMYVDDDKYMKNLRKIIIDQVETIVYGLF